MADKLQSIQGPGLSPAEEGEYAERTPYREVGQPIRMSGPRRPKPSCAERNEPIKAPLG